MHRRRLSAFVAIILVCVPGVVYGQFTDPRTYANTPAGVNQLELNYGHATADDSIDTSLVIAGSHLEINEAPVAYTRTFGIMHRLAWVKAAFHSLTSAVPWPGAVYPALLPVPVTRVCS